jgi:hypothetical protein
MAISKTSTINKALTLCGASPIVNITEDAPNARVANRVYEISLKSILGECKWNFATTRTTLTLSAATQPWYHTGELYTYTKPSSVIRIFETSDPDAVWREEGDYIISDTASLGIKYVYYHDDPSKYPSLFLDAFIDKLASDVCYMIINSATKAEAFYKKYKTISLNDAMSANSQTGTQQEPKDDEWLRAKTGSIGNPARSYD